MLRIVSLLASILVYYGLINFPQTKICTLKSSTSIPTSTINICPNFVLENMNSNESETLKLNLDEHFISRFGHVEGLKPESYRINFYFSNRTHYEGRIEIIFVVKVKTNRVVLNRHKKSPEIDYEKIFLNSLCENGRDENACIEKVVVMDNEFLLQLTKSLQPGEKYKLTVPNFRGYAFKEYEEIGSLGLASSGSDEQGYYALTTIFQMRYARTVFPCFDYPNLKAKFQVCIDHPSKWTAASNTPLLAESGKGNEKGYAKSCFQETPIMSTYVFTIALMENYTLTNLTVNESDRSIDQPLIQLYSPTPKTKELSWILAKTRDAMDKMRMMTNFTYPLPSMSIFVVYPSPFWGIENFGLVTTEGAFMEMQDYEKSKIILNHEMVHQWLGNVATISEWNEICLQEGLTALIEWKLSEDLYGISMNGQAQQASSGKRDYPSFLRRYNLTQHIADHCFGLPPVFFKLISDVYGFETWELFLNRLLTEYRFGNANIDDWDRLLVEASGDQNLKGYLASWFGQPGFAFIFASSINRDQDILINQGHADNYERVISNDQTTRPIPISILTEDNRLTNLTVPKVQNFTYRLEKIDNRSDFWFVVDPQNRIMARKIYELKNYHRLFSNNEIVAKYRKSISSDFCQGLLLDVFPWGQDDRSFDERGWLDFFQLVIKGEKIEKSCRCCLNTKEENEKNGQCAYEWNRECKRLRIMKLLGRNYTLPNENPFGNG